MQWIFVALQSVSALLVGGGADANQQAEEGESLPAGLIAVYRDEDGLHTASVWRVEPTIGFMFKSGESPHPRINDRVWSARWRGQLQVFRAGRYQFSAELAGSLKVRVAGQVVLSAELNGDAHEPIVGPEIDVTAGHLPIEVEYAKRDGPAQLRLFWQTRFFSREPVPWTVLRHAPSDSSPELIQSMKQDRGRFLFEELSCVACHRAADDDALGRGLARRQGPDLSRIGERAYAGWIARWLEDPQAFRPQALMPRMFADDDRGHVERFAVTSYLAGLGGPPRPARQEQSRDELRNSRRRGERLFSRVGCSVCHATRESTIATLKFIGSKTTPERLAEFLQNPLAVDPSGRMPQMQLNGGEARDLANFLCESSNDDWPRDLPLPGEETAGTIDTISKQVATSVDDADQLARLQLPQRLRAIGERLVVRKGCTNCHRVAPGGKELPSRSDLAPLARLRAPEVQNGGCLRRHAAPVDRDGPSFALSEEHQECLRAFLTSASTGSGAVAPAYTAQATLRRFQCVACHSRSGQGGLDPDRMDELRRYESAQDAEAIQPPPLTDVGSKLRGSWLTAVLTQGRRARPWMALRMPQFGPANVSQLPDQLRAADAAESDDTIRQFAYDPEHVEAGRFLVGKRGFGCISCHDIAGRPNSGTRGPDLASMAERVRFDWYSRWLDDPQRMQPGTRMPTVFPNATTAIKNVLDGNAHEQSQAIWEYLSLGANLPLPDGLEPPKGLVLEPRQKPILIRSFLPDAGSRGIAVGFPSGLSFAFDASQGRLAYAWTGQFIDAGPIWQNRGGTPAGIQGPRFWSAPPGCPWELTDSPASIPKWSDRTTNPALGGRLPEGELFEGQRRMQFHDYKLADDDSPILHYSIRSESNGTPELDIEERVAPIQRLAGVGLLRSFELQSDHANNAWLLLAETNLAIKPLDALGEPIDTEPNREIAEYPVLETIVQVGGQNGVQLFQLISAPADARWVISKSSDTWRLIVRLPVPASRKNKVVIALLCPYRNEPAMIRAFLREITSP